MAHLEALQHHGGMCGSPPSCASSWVLLDFTNLETLSPWSFWPSSSRPRNHNCPVPIIFPILSSSFTAYMPCMRAPTTTLLLLLCSQGTGHRDWTGSPREISKGHKQVLGHHTQKKTENPLLGQRALCRSRTARRMTCFLSALGSLKTE